MSGKRKRRRKTRDATPVECREENRLRQKPARLSKAKVKRTSDRRIGHQAAYEQLVSDERCTSLAGNSHANLLRLEVMTSEPFGFVMIGLSQNSVAFVKRNPEESGAHSVTCCTSVTRLTCAQTISSDASQVDRCVCLRLY